MTTKRTAFRIARFALYGLGLVGGIAAAVVASAGVLFYSAGLDRAVSASAVAGGTFSGMAWILLISVVLALVRSLEARSRCTVVNVNHHGRT